MNRTPMATGVCAECGAERRIQARGMCVACYTQWRRTRPGACAYCGSIRKDGGTGKHEDCLADRRDRWHTYRLKVIDGYGGCCACCGITGYDFLTIDHVNNDGAAHRRLLDPKYGRDSRRILLQIINEGFPAAYQVLCWNCNFGRARNGGTCPHVAAMLDVITGAIKEEAA